MRILKWSKNNTTTTKTTTTTMNDNNNNKNNDQRMRNVFNFSTKKMFALIAKVILFVRRTKTNKFVGDVKLILGFRQFGSIHLFGFHVHPTSEHKLFGIGENSRVMATIDANRSLSHSRTLSYLYL